MYIPKKAQDSAADKKAMAYIAIAILQCQEKKLSTNVSIYPLFLNTGPCLHLHRLPDPVDGPQGIFNGPEGGQAEEMLSRGSEAGAGGADDIGPLQEVVKKRPAGHVIRGPEPDIGRVDTS